MAKNPDRGTLRAIRATTIAVVALGISVGGHAFAHGGTPRAGALGGGLAITLLVGLNTSGSRYTLGRAFVVLAVAQPVLHLTFGLGAHPSHSATSAQPFVSAQAVADTTMLGAHLLAALLAAAWISQGDALLWRWVGQVWRQLVQPMSTLVDFLTTGSDVAHGSPGWSALSRLIGSLSHRGPPLSA